VDPDHIQFFFFFCKLTCGRGGARTCRLSRGHMASYDEEECLARGVHTPKVSGCV
jgi:hypothetical protein